MMRIKNNKEECFHQKCGDNFDKKLKKKKGKMLKDLIPLACIGSDIDKYDLEIRIRFSSKMGRNIL